MNNGIFFDHGELSDLLAEKIPLNEVYFGKTKELLAAEQQLDKFRNKYINKYVVNMKVNSDPDLLEFDRMIEQIFGFGCLTLHIHNQAVANAFTLPIDFQYDTQADAIVADERGFKFKKEMDYACILGIYSGIIFNPNFTTPEVMAILLHEVGHNFHSSINRSGGTMINFYKTVCCMINLLSGCIIQTYKNTNSYRRLVDKTGKKWREQNTMPVIVYDFFMQIGNLLRAGINTFNDLLRVISMGTLTLSTAVINCTFTIFKAIKHPVETIANLFSKKLSFNSELSADNFVTMYGYGGDLSSALTKMGDKEGASASVIMKSFDKIPVISTLMHFTEAPVILLYSILDEHPNDVSRIKDQMALLNNELKNTDIDPKMKHVIESDIRECEAAYNHLIDISGALKDPYLYRKVYNKFINHINLKNKMLGGRAAKIKFDEYDRAFKRNYDK